MLMIDDNKMKLLKMRRKILEMATGDNSRALEEYKTIILEIDRDAYNDLITEIKSADYSNLTYEEQIELFNQIDADYEYLNELQYSFKSLYLKYSGMDIELSNIDTIAIDAIRERVSAIQGYLLNSKNLVNSRTELEKLNADYIKENKMNETIIGQINTLEEKTKNDLLFAEGRVQNGSLELEYTSIVDEFKHFGLDLKKMLGDISVLNECINQAKKEYTDNEEMLEAADICYQNGRVDDKDVYDRIRIDTLKSKYKLILISIVMEICSTSTDYSLIRNKIDRIIDLIKQRKKTLTELNIRHFIDPFDRLNLNSYEEIINLLDENMTKISSIRKTMAYFTSTIEDLSFENDMLLRKINEELTIITDGNNRMRYGSQSKYEVDTGLDSLLLTADADDMVVKVSDISSDFMLERAHEKARGVVTRVNQMYNDAKVKVSSEHVVKAPKLVIESKTESKKNDELFMDDTPFEEEKDSVGVILDDPFLDKKESKKKDDLFEEAVPFEDNSKKKKSSDNELFREVQPFVSTPLFEDKADEDLSDYDKMLEIISEGDILGNTMTNIFGDIDEEGKKILQEGSLEYMDGIDSKTKRRVA